MEKGFKLIDELRDTESFDKAELHTFRGSTIVAKKEISKHELKALKGWVYPASKGLLLGNPTHYEFHITYKNEVKIFRFELETNMRGISDLKRFDCLRQNFGVLYEDTQSDKELIMGILDSLHSTAIEQPSTIVGTKNLIYFTVGGSVDYIPLLVKAINSILRNNDASQFDILIITTSVYLSYLQKNKFLQGLTNVKIHEVDTLNETDGVYVSMNKLKVFSYPEINNYSKILFLDCDMACIKNFESLFAQELDSTTLYTISNPVVTLAAHENIYHGLDYDDPETITNIKAANQKPFNAGQFLFANSAQMRAHFDNLLWLSSVWPSFFFFEQCFMNRYFCKYEHTFAERLTPYFSLVSVTTDNPTIKMHKDSDSFIHFIAPPMQPLVKLQFIEDYANAHQLRI